MSTKNIHGLTSFIDDYDHDEASPLWMTPLKMALLDFEVRKHDFNAELKVQLIEGMFGNCIDPETKGYGMAAKLRDGKKLKPVAAIISPRSLGRLHLEEMNSSLFLRVFCLADEQDVAMVAMKGLIFRWALDQTAKAESVLAAATAAIDGHLSPPSPAPMRP